MNVDVQEFFPRFQIPQHLIGSKVNCDAPSNDLERKETAPSPKPKVEAPKVVKTSLPSKPAAGRVSKKEIIEGIKSMEQQNIDLMATKHQSVTSASQSDEWNVIKKGKKVKVVKDIKLEVSASDVCDVKKDKIEEIKIEEPKTEVVSVPEPVKKSPPAPAKPKKSKGKNKKKKTHMLAKQDGFEIIEPEFSHSAAVEVDEVSPELSEDEAMDENVPGMAVGEPQEAENEVLNEVKLVVTVEQEVVTKIIKEVAQAPPDDVQEKSPNVQDLPKPNASVVDDDVIDISDEDICCNISSQLELSEVHKIEHVAMKQQKVEVKPEVSKKPVVSKEPEVTQQPEVSKKPEVQEKSKNPAETKTPEKPEVLLQPEEQAKPEVHLKPEVEIKLEDSVKPEVVTKPKVQLKLEIKAKPEIQMKREAPAKPEVPKKKEVEAKPDPFQDMDFFNDRTNIAALERDLMENLRLLDDEIDIKSPIINPLYDFPITSAVRKWLQEKQSESFDNLFHVHNLKKLSELYGDDEDDETESDISEKELKSETDSDYASDFHAKNGGSPTCSTHAKGSSKCNKLVAKESFCALM